MMIDIQKIRRFERYLEKYNNSHVVAEIWNEIEPQITTAMQYAESLENDLLEQQVYHNKMMKLVERMDNAIHYGNDLLDDVKQWRRKYGH